METIPKQFIRSEKVREYTAVLAKVLSIGFIIASIINCSGGSTKRDAGNKAKKEGRNKNSVSVICQCGEAKILSKGNNQAEAEARASEKCKKASPQSSVSSCELIMKPDK